MQTLIDPQKVETKVQVGSLAAAFAVALVWFLEQFDITMSAPVAMAFATLVFGIAAWLAPHTQRTGAHERGKYRA